MKNPNQKMKTNWDTKFMGDEKPTPEQVIAVLNNLISCMNTSVIILKKYGREDKAEELDGATFMVKEWVASLLEEKNKP